MFGLHQCKKILRQAVHQIWFFQIDQMSGRGDDRQPYGRADFFQEKAGVYRAGIFVADDDVAGCLECAKRAGHVE